jgi:DNA-directed RNA polymerase specialized sigma24 family protein
MRPDELARVAHDPATSEAFYREHVEAVQRFVVRYVADPHLAADLSAEVFVAAIGAVPSYIAARSTLRGQLFDDDTRTR